MYLQSTVISLQCSIYVFLCVWEQVCVHVHVHMCVPAAYRGQRSASGICHCGFPPFSLTKSSSLCMCVCMCATYCAAYVGIEDSFQESVLSSNSWIPGTKIQSPDFGCRCLLPQAQHLGFWDRVSHQAGWPAASRNPSVSAFSALWLQAGTAAASIIMWVLEIKLMSSCLHGSPVFHVICAPAPGISLSLFSQCFLPCICCLIVLLLRSLLLLLFNIVIWCVFFVLYFQSVYI